MPHCMCTVGSTSPPARPHGEPAGGVLTVQASPLLIGQLSSSLFSLPWKDSWTPVVTQVLRLTARRNGHTESNPYLLWFLCNERFTELGLDFLVASSSQIVNLGPIQRQAFTCLMLPAQPALTASRWSRLKDLRDWLAFSHPQAAQ